VSRIRFGIIFLLLVLILLVVSALFGLLTYWLDAGVLPASTPVRGSMGPVEHHHREVNAIGRYARDCLQHTPSPLRCWEVKV
jgi:hypothetical protein